jgi:hypothetical protein
MAAVLAPDAPWHKLSQKEMGPAVARLIEGYKKEQSGRRDLYVRNLELYENRAMRGYSAYAYSGSSSEQGLPGTVDRLRLLRSAVSTAVANIYAPQKPKPQFQTLGATWATRRKAYRLDRICEGVLNQRQGRYQNVWTFMADKCVDTPLQGVTAIKVMADRVQKRIAHKAIPTPDIFTDPAEGSEPNNWFQREPLDEATALETWPKAKKAILGAAPYEWFGSQPTAQRLRATKMIEIQYAWRLPFGPDEPGTWAVVVGGECVEMGEWAAPMPPFVFVIWEPHRDGPWGAGIIDEGGGLALDAGDLDLRLSYRERIAAFKTTWVPESSGVNMNDVASNEAHKAIKYDGPTPPTETLSVPFSPMELEYLQEKKKDFWYAIGISQVSAAARREPGIESGVAQRTLNDTKAGRQLPKGQRYEQAYVDLAHQYVWRFRELAEDDKDFAVTWQGKTTIRSYNWAENDVEDDAFDINVASSAALPHDPAGRQETVQNWYAAGLISQETAKQLMGQPDIDAELQIENAETEYVDMLIERYLDAEQDTFDMYEYEPPQSFIFNKIGALKRFASAWARARIDAAALPIKERPPAEFAIGLLVRWIHEMDELIKGPEPVAPPAGAGGPMPAMTPDGLPMRAPGMTPDMLPPGPVPPPVMAA